jgi:hypothetical protein
MKPTDKAILGMVSELPGVTKVNPQVASKQNLDPEAELPGSGRRQHGMARADRCDMTLRRGGRDSTVTRTC